MLLDSSEFFNIRDYKCNIVVVVLEGGSDLRYLESALTAIFKKYDSTVKFAIISDFTGDKFYEKNNPSKLFDIFVEGELRGPKNKFNEEIGKRIIDVYHILDIDNAFITEDHVFEDKNKKNFYYTHNGIYYEDRNKVIERNNTKQSQLIKLINKKQCNIFGICVDYHVYYYSVNIDDFYFDKLNISQDDKNFLGTEYGGSFASKSNSGKIKKFYSDIEKRNPKNYPTTYEQTWEYIQISNNCLKKCSNIFLIGKNRYK